MKTHDLRSISKNHRSRLSALWARYGVLAATLVALARYLLSFAPRLTGTDDAVYLMLARSLATGHGLVDLHIAGTPPHTWYPFGFPLLLAPVIWIEPESPANVPLAMLVPLICGVLCIPLASLCLVRLRDASPGLAAFVGLFMALNWVEGWFATKTLLSETAYMVFSFLALLFTHQYIAAPRPRWWQAALASLFIAAGFFTRQVGVTLLAAAVAYALLQRRPRRAGALLILGGLLYAPWAYRNAMVGTSALAGSYWDQFLRVKWDEPLLGTVTWSGLLIRLLENIWGHATGTIVQLLLPVPGEGFLSILPSFLADTIPVVTGLGLSALIVMGYTRHLSRRVGLVEIYLPFYLGMILLPSWQTVRNLVPVLPFLIYYLIEGLRGLVGIAQSRKLLGNLSTTPPVALVVVLLLLSNLYADRQELRDGAMYRSIGMFYYQGYAGIERDFFEASQWIRANTPPEALFFYRFPEKLFLYTGRQTVGELTSIPVPVVNFMSIEDLIDEIRQRVDYVVVAPSDRDKYGDLGGMIAADSGAFVPVFATSGERRVIIYEVHRGQQRP